MVNILSNTKFDNDIFSWLENHLFLVLYQILYYTIPKKLKSNIYHLIRLLLQIQSIMVDGLTFIHFTVYIRKDAVLISTTPRTLTAPPDLLSIQKKSLRVEGHQG